MKLASAFILILIVCSCEKKELPVKPYDRGDVITSQVGMGSDYRNQIWFSLADNRIVSTNLKTDWDLAFEASADGYHVFLNGAKSMRVYKTSHTSLQQVSDTSGMGVSGLADAPSGNMDSTAVGNWQPDHKVYVLSLGYNEMGLHQGYYKFKIMSNNASQYTLEYAPLAAAQASSAVVLKDGNYNFMCFSFSGGRQVPVEPVKNGFDLCFTQYTHLFLNPLQYYQVTGVLTKAGTRVALINSKPFTEVGINDTAAAKFSARRDAIGFDWKSFSLKTNLYTVNDKQVYLICDSKGFYYKLHFVDFYDASGIKGFPKFEFKKL